MRNSKLLEMAIAQGKSSYEIPGPDIFVKWRKGDHAKVWVFSRGVHGLEKMGYAFARRNWKMDPLSRDVFVIKEIEAKSKKYEDKLIELLQEIVYPVMFRNPENKYKKISKAPSALFKNAFSIRKFEKKFKIKLL